jgi:hypothetical protein
MGTQREIADMIVEKNGHYLFALKNNRQSLFEDVECAFKMHGGYDIYETLEADHGRMALHIVSEQKDRHTVLGRDFIKQHWI